MSYRLKSTLDGQTNPWMRCGVVQDLLAGLLGLHYNRELVVSMGQSLTYNS